MTTITVGMVGTYPPTRCGIATFTQSLDQELRRMPRTDTRVIQLLEPHEPLPIARIGDGAPAPQPLVNGDPASLQQAARRLNRECDAVIAQHEFGIYGGSDGAEILQLLSQLSIPIVLVLHTVLDDPSANQRAVIEQASAMAHNVVVMGENAENVLLSRYTIDSRRVRRIPHGVFTVPRIGAERHAESGLTMLTWGLLGPGKGIEWVIMAMALLQSDADVLRYRVLGQTHPKVLEREGEEYRRMLRRLSRDLGVADRVDFVDEYLARDELAHEIAEADLVVLPYDSRVQATSGVLVEALSARVPVIATRFPYAREMIPHGQGWLVPHQDPRGLADAVEQAMRASRQPARAPWPSRVRGVSTDWADVAEMYRRLVDRAVAVRTA